MRKNFIAALEDSGSETEFLRHLKLQLLTREQIVIAGSALLSKAGLSLLQREPALSSAIREKAILPAIRDSFDGVSDFVLSLQDSTLLPQEKEALCNYVPHRLSWKLRDATSEFETLFVSGMLDDSPLHQGFGLPAELANEVVALARDKSTSMNSDWIRPEAAKVSAKLLAPHVSQSISDFIELLYRICGANAVRATPMLPSRQFETYVHKFSPHFAPNVSSSDIETALFWSSFVSAVHDFESEAVGFSAAQLDSLCLASVLKIRQKFEMREFWLAYWKTVERAATCQDTSEAVEIADVAWRTKQEFAAAIRAESKLSISDAREQFLGESASTLVKIGDFASLGVLPVLGAGYKLIVKTFEWRSPKVAKKIENVRMRARAILNGRTQPKKPLLEGYDAITCRPISKDVKN